MRKMISTFSLHCITSFPISISQRFMLHCLYCKRFSDHAPGHFPSPSAFTFTNFWRFSDHAPGHFPSPSAFTFTNFWRFRVPPSQSLEHQDHFVHSLSSQSFSQLCALHAFD